MLLPHDTRRWTDCRQRLHQHHHVSLDGAKFSLHVQRVCRHLTGRAIGVILGGGGARGLAHVGVLQAMDELGVPVDCIGGASQGSMIAACYAKYGCARDQFMKPMIDEFVRTMSSKWTFFTELTVPLLSTTTGFGFSALLKRPSLLGPTRDIHDLWIPFFCTSTNVGEAVLGGGEMVHTSGLLWKLVRASMSILGYFPPVYHEGKLLVRYNTNSLRATTRSKPYSVRYNTRENSL